MNLTTFIQPGSRRLLRTYLSWLTGLIERLSRRHGSCADRDRATWNNRTHVRIVLPRPVLSQDPHHLQS